MNTDKYLEGILKQFEYYKSLADKAVAQIADECLFSQINENSNSIAIIMKHMSGNMHSRWTDFLTSDLEKSWINRDDEFINSFNSKSALLIYWEAGWALLFETIKALKPNDLDKIVFIRNQGHTVNEAINRQLAHYAYHVGQIVLLAKIYATEWKTLSIAKGDSKNYNNDKFQKEQEIVHFTEEYLENNVKKKL
jgi:hypothetical protein